MILAGEVRRFGYNLAGHRAYHAGPALTEVREQRRINYAQRVYHNLATLDPHGGDGMRINAAGNR